MKLRDVRDVLIGIVVFALLLSPLMCFRGCVDEAGATRVLQQQGYKDIRMTGWRPMMAGQDDTFATGFEATSPSGDRVSGAVTNGVMKGYTIRLD